MKKKITQLLAIAMVFCTTAFAGNIDGKVNGNIKIEFSQRFAGATDVTWPSSSNYAKANFQLDGQFMSAYFTNTGEVIGTARHLASSQLPGKLQVELKKNLSNAWISELFNYSTDEDTTFYVTLETADYRTILKNDVHNWTVVKKIRKN